ncbi:hypothetical protein EYF80_036638 [Liparis tanakae]|uniref:Uncharacterized protein n=1 Tax=Liparis tanakae TaxID=230148 RepID=A0A4Z2GI00_9TELE|nr:hypothetical protein EYF80_036638 [Liparis tanakae]
MDDVVQSRYQHSPYCDYQSHGDVNQEQQDDPEPQQQEGDVFIDAITDNVEGGDHQDDEQQRRFICFHLFLWEQGQTATWFEAAGSSRFSRVRRVEEERSEDSGSASFESSNRAQGPASAVPGRDRLAQTHSSSTGSSTQKISTSTEGEREGGGGMEGEHDGLEAGELSGIDGEGLEAAEDLLQEAQVQAGVAGLALHAGAEVGQREQRAAVQRQRPLDGTEQEQLAPRLLQQDHLAEHQ